MKRKWTDEEVEQLKSLLETNLTDSEIADRLGRTLKAVRMKLDYIRRTPIQRDMDRKRCRTYYRRLRPIKAHIHDNAQVIESSRPDEETLAERDRRYATPFRDLTGLLLGDPPVGYSAMDRGRA